jgi:hypothetical protein
MEKTNPANDFAPAALRTVAANADGSDSRSNPTVRANLLKINDQTDADGADANRPPQSAPEKTGTATWSMRL